MTEQPIRFSTDILVRLGEELNPNADQGIIELVKNAYDADATECIVHLRNVTSTGGTITVTDNGDGMSFSDIRNGWLVLGRSRKMAQQRTMRLGRIPAGNKGLGRLAALRLGSRVHMTTATRESNTQYSVTFDWSRYGQSRLVEDVPVEIIESPRERDHGTTIVIEDVTHVIGRNEAKRLARALILLADPFDSDDDSFTPSLKSEEYQDLQRLVESLYFDDAEFHLKAVLRSGVVSAVVTDWRGGVLFQADHEDITTRSRQGNTYNAPDATFDLWAFLLTRQGFELRTSSVAEVRSWIENFGGVHLYLNGLRVAPYGNAGNDWLDMNLRRVQSPEERPGTNTSIGRVYVEDDQGYLSQKTDRSGFIENESFEELRAFAQDALEWMARRRLSAAEARRQKEREDAQKNASSTREGLREQIKRVPDELQPQLQRAFDRYDRERQNEADALRREVELYRTLSTAGITAATFAHESGGYPLKLIGLSIDAIERRALQALNASDYDSKMARPISSVRSAMSSLGVLSTATLQLIDADKRRVGRVELNAVIGRTLEVFEPLLSGRDVSVRQELAQGRPYLQGTESAVESILTNLINNSLAAFQGSESTERVIQLSTEVDGERWRLTFSDSGPGIDGISVKDIWLPGQTSRPGGTGLGLTIVRDAVKDLSGTVRAVAHGPLSGAMFVIELPILGVEQ